MKKIILFFTLISITTFTYAYTATYKCEDRHEDFSFFVNIDENSLHYGSSKENLYLFDFDKTLKKKDKRLIHFFSYKNIDYTVHQNSTNPVDIYIDDFKDKKIRYEYKCKLHRIIGNSDKIPITFITIPKNKKFLKNTAINRK